MRCSVLVKYCNIYKTEILISEDANVGIKSRTVTTYTPTGWAVLSWNRKKRIAKNLKLESARFMQTQERAACEDEQNSTVTRVSRTTTQDRKSKSLSERHDSFPRCAHTHMLGDSLHLEEKRLEVLFAPNP